MADQQLFREKSLKYISSPEQINDYLKVTKPAVWGVLVAIIILLAGLFIWANFAYIGSSIDGTVVVEDGIMTMKFKSQEYGANVKEGMTIQVGDSYSPITSVGKVEDGFFAVASTDLLDGVYDATVTYKQTQVISLLLGN